MAQVLTHPFISVLQWGRDREVADSAAVPATSSHSLPCFNGAATARSRIERQPTCTGLPGCRFNGAATARSRIG